MRVRLSSLSACWIALWMTITVTLSFVQAAGAQTYGVLHTFTGGADGGTPYGGLTWDGGSNFYGTAAQGGYTGTLCVNGSFGNAHGCGTVYRLTRSGSNWSFTTLYEFLGGAVDGNFPEAAVTIGPNGSLYGTTWAGYDQDCRTGARIFGCGIVFNLTPPANVCKTARCFWTENILHGFGDFMDGAGPGLGNLIFDRAGNIYGTNWNGRFSDGVVFELGPTDGSWTLERLLQIQIVQGQPYGLDNGLVADTSGNLYATSWAGPYGSPNCSERHGCGTVIQFTPTQSSWDTNIIYAFQGQSDGLNPTGALVMDAAGNLYGTTATGGAGGAGTVFELSPSNGGWTYHLIYSFSGGNSQSVCYPFLNQGCSGPWGTLLLDGSGNLYGTTYANGAFEAGNVFKLTQTNGTWTYTDLYDFAGGTDGANPIGSLVLDGNGNLFGTTANGGSDGYGVAFELNP